MKTINSSRNKDGCLEILFEKQERVTIKSLTTDLVRVEWVQSHDFPYPISDTSGGIFYSQYKGGETLETYSDRLFNFLQEWLSLEQMASLDLVKYLTPHQIATLKTKHD